ncbi:DNA replication licensing factor Mcm3 [Diaphorina citri]|uniref:DNA replication licensing factor MCM3 n=1 Tax=Diaphorina citri TaxID=121845 RepID=A0A1S3DBD4_DIACI|nr:DNA replication licensing factor Mcm3 [Diaphorina citri]
MEEEIDQRIRAIQSEYLDFLDDEEDQGMYQKKVKSMIEDGRRRLLVNINDLRRKNPTRALNLLTNAFEECIAFQRALKDYVASVDSTFAYNQEEFFVAFEGSFGNKHVTPRTLTSRYLGNIVCLEGIVTKCSLVRPKVVKSVHYCPATGKQVMRRYTDLTSFDAFQSSSVYPTKDDDGNILETEYGLSVYKDHQTITVQEMPEKAPAGQLPRSVDIICDNDLVDLCKPGDRIQIVGNYRCLPSKQGGFTAGTFRTILIANHIAHLTKEATMCVTREDIINCRKLAKKRNIFELLASSLAPSIHGHAYIKKAILCLLLGGVEKVLPNGTRLRGDINVLLIGDPSVAKSQLLRYVLCTAPRAIPTTGRGSSGVGLTAAVTSDPETGDRHLENVLSIQAKLNARCSVLAAANPVYGKYDQYKTPMENIGLQDSLLSRFDLLFVMLDLVDSENDRKISDHVVRMHRYRDPREQDGTVLPLESSVDILSTNNPDQAEEELRTPLYEKYNALLHGTSRSKTDKILSMQFMKKYIHVAKVLKPILTEEASEMIAEEYSKLRCQDLMESDVARTQPVTVRTLETLIRLSTAHAKARLSRSVEKEDAEAAIELVQFAYFKKVLEKPSKKKRRRNEEGEEVDEATEDEDENEDARSERPASRADSEEEPRPKRTRTLDPYDISEIDEDMTTLSSGSQVAGSSSTSLALPTNVSSEKFSLFKEKVSNLFRSERTDALSVSRIVQHLNDAGPGEARFEPGEIAAAFERLKESNQIMITDNIAILI